jgi:RNA polymerase sigma factor (sigma-70 family)
MHRLLTTLLRRLAPPDDPSSDAAVLLRFVRHHDETAFELLVWRHGGLVMGVCRRMLRDDHLAEDAFQATFLILARKAASVRGSLAGWLHQVARRVCLNARKRDPVPAEPGSERGVFDADPLLPVELRAVLDEEIARLPVKQRLVVLLCYLQGRTTDDAAQFLGVPQGTVLSRLDAARKRLRLALTRRGVTVPAALFATALNTPDLSAEVCLRATAAAIDYLNSAAVISVPSQLAHEVTQMTARKMALGMMAAVVLVSGVGTGVGLLMAQGGKAPPTKAADKPPAEQKVDPAKSEHKPTDGELETKLRMRRIDELHVNQQQVSIQIERLEERRLKLVADAGSEVDPAALQSKLGGIDKSILGLEDAIATKPDDIKAQDKRVGEVKASRFPNEDLIQDEVNRNIQNTPEVSKAWAAYMKRQQDVDRLKQQVSQESEVLKEAEKLLKAAAADLNTARETVHPREDKAYRDQYVKVAEAELTALKNDLDRMTKSLKSYREKRVELAVRIQRAKASQNAQQLLDDEIQVLREIRKQVLRERLLLEIGLDKQK